MSMKSNISQSDLIGIRTMLPDGRSGCIIRVRLSRETGEWYAEVNVDTGGRVISEVKNLSMAKVEKRGVKHYEATPMVQPTLFDETPYIKKARGGAR